MYVEDAVLHTHTHADTRSDLNIHTQTAARKCMFFFAFLSIFFCRKQSLPFLCLDHYIDSKTRDFVFTFFFSIVPKAAALHQCQCDTIMPDPPNMYSHGGRITEHFAVLALCKVGVGA